MTRRAELNKRRAAENVCDQDLREMAADTPDLVSKYPPWPKNLVLKYILERPCIPVWMLALVAFAGYWGVPLVLSAWDGTLVTAGWLQSLGANLAGFPHLQRLVTAISKFQGMQGGMAYLSDRSHFVFASIGGPGGAVAILALRGIQKTVLAMRRDNLPTGDESFFASNYNDLRELANHSLGRALSVGLAAIAFFVFLNFHLNPTYSYWWGSSVHGHAGLVFACIEFVMVYYGTQVMIQLAAGSLMLARMFSGGLDLRPFHPDGCNGLAPLGRIIFTLWIFALLLAGEIIVTLFLGYLGLEKMQLAWILAAMATITLPLVAILPLYASLRAIQQTRGEELGRFEPLLNELFGQSKVAVREGDFDHSLELVGSLNELRGIHELLTAMNVWPFNPRALALVTLVYAVQVLLTLREVLGF